MAPNQNPNLGPNSNYINVEPGGHLHMSINSDRTELNADSIPVTSTSTSTTTTSSTSTTSSATTTHATTGSGGSSVSPARVPPTMQDFADAFFLRGGDLSTLLTSLMMKLGGYAIGPNNTYFGNRDAFTGMMLTEQMKLARQYRYDESMTDAAVVAGNWGGVLRSLGMPPELFRQIEPALKDILRNFQYLPDKMLDEIKKLPLGLGELVTQLITTGDMGRGVSIAAMINAIPTYDKNNEVSMKTIADTYAAYLRSNFSMYGIGERGLKIKDAVSAFNTLQADEIFSPANAVARYEGNWQEGLKYWDEISPKIRDRIALNKQGKAQKDIAEAMSHTLWMDTEGLTNFEEGHAGHNASIIKQLTNAYSANLNPKYADKEVLSSALATLTAFLGTPFTSGESLDLTKLQKAIDEKVKQISEDTSISETNRAAAAKEANDRLQTALEIVTRSGLDAVSGTLMNESFSDGFRETDEDYRTLVELQQLKKAGVREEDINFQKLYDSLSQETKDEIRAYRLQKSSRFYMQSLQQMRLFAQNMEGFDQLKQQVGGDDNAAVSALMKSIFGGKDAYRDFMHLARISTDNINDPNILTPANLMNALSGAGLNVQQIVTLGNSITKGLEESGLSTAGMPHMMKTLADAAIGYHISGGFDAPGSLSMDAFVSTLAKQSLSMRNSMEGSVVTAMFAMSEDELAKLRSSSPEAAQIADKLRSGGILNDTEIQQLKNGTLSNQITKGLGSYTANRLFNSQTAVMYGKFASMASDAYQYLGTTIANENTFSQLFNASLAAYNAENGTNIDAKTVGDIVTALGGTGTALAYLTAEGTARDDILNRLIEAGTVDAKAFSDFSKNTAALNATRAALSILSPEQQAAVDAAAGTLIYKDIMLDPVKRKQYQEMRAEMAMEAHQTGIMGAASRYLEDQTRASFVDVLSGLPIESRERAFATSKGFRELTIAMLSSMGKDNIIGLSNQLGVDINSESYVNLKDSLSKGLNKNKAEQEALSATESVYKQVSDILADSSLDDKKRDERIAKVGEELEPYYTKESIASILKNMQNVAHDEAQAIKLAGVKQDYQGPLAFLMSGLGGLFKGVTDILTDIYNFMSDGPKPAEKKEPTAG